MSKPRKLSERLRELIQKIEESDRRSQELLNKYVSDTSKHLGQMSLLLEEID